jgi:lactam utilization protein B
MAGVRIDLKCDLGDRAGRDAEPMAQVTTATVACRAQAGDADTVRLARGPGAAVEAFAR